METVTFYVTLYTCGFILSVILKCLVYNLLIALKITSLNRLKVNPEKLRFMTLVWVKEIERKLMVSNSIIHSLEEIINMRNFN